MNETAGRQMTAEGLQVLITDADMNMHPLLADRPAQRNDFGINLFFMYRFAVRHPKPDMA